MKLKSKNLLTPTLALAALLAASCSSDDDDGGDMGPMNPANITAGVNSLGLTTLASALQAAGLDDDLMGAGPFTLFAPSNAAFAALDPALLAFLLDPLNQAVLEDALQYHLLNANVDAATVGGLTTTAAANGDDILVDNVDGSIYVNDARVTVADQVTDNGRIHVINAVMLPPDMIATALGDRGLNNLVAAVGASSLDLTAAAPVTVLAPSDAAFEQFAIDAGAADFADFLANAAQVDVDDLLNGHIVSGLNRASAVVGAGDAAAASGNLLFFNQETGMNATVDGIDITAFNIPTTANLVHEIDGVIEARDDTVTTATNAGLSTLVANVQAVDTANGDTALVDILNGAGPLTIFAPTDAAWTDASLTNLQMAGNEAALEEVLRNHIVADAIQAKELGTLANVTSDEGSMITISVDMTTGAISLDTDPGNVGNVTGNVTMANVFTANAVVHVVDAVLVPPTVTLP